MTADAGFGEIQLFTGPELPAEIVEDVPAEVDLSLSEAELAAADGPGVPDNGILPAAAADQAIITDFLAPTQQISSVAIDQILGADSELDEVIGADPLVSDFQTPERQVLRSRFIETLDSQESPEPSEKPATADQLKVLGDQQATEFREAEILQA